MAFIDGEFRTVVPEWSAPETLSHGFFLKRGEQLIAQRRRGIDSDAAGHSQHGISFLCRSVDTQRLDHPRFHV